MDESISRAAAIDALNECRERTERPEEFAGLKIAVGVMRALPPAQPEIIRCKDCKYITEHYDTDGNVPYWTCSEWDSGTDYDGFCHYAERRTDE